MAKRKKIKPLKKFRVKGKRKPFEFDFRFNKKSEARKRAEYNRKNGKLSRVVKIGKQYNVYKR